MESSTAGVTSPPKTSPRTTPPSIVVDNHEEHHVTHCGKQIRRPWNPCCLKIRLQIGVMIIAMIEIIYSIMIGVFIIIYASVTFMVAGFSQTEQSCMTHTEQLITVGIIYTVGLPVCILELVCGLTLLQGARTRDLKKCECWLVGAVVALIVTGGLHLWMWYCLLCVIYFIKELKFHQTVKEIMTQNRLAATEQQRQNDFDDPDIGGVTKLKSPNPSKRNVKIIDLDKESPSPGLSMNDPGASRQDLSAV